MLEDDKLATAVIDEFVHHSRLVEFSGISGGMDAALMLGGEGLASRSAVRQRSVVNLRSEMSVRSLTNTDCRIIPLASTPEASTQVGIASEKLV